MARFPTRFPLAALPAALCLASPALAQPAFVNAPVTAPMVMAAMDICTGQLRAGAFDGDALTRSGWVVAVRSDGDPVIRTYRHPDNMILLSTLDSRGDPDKCMVMAPVGRGVTIDEMRSSIDRQTGVRPVNQADATVWNVDGASFAMKQMGPVGLVVEIQLRNSDVDPR